MKAIILAAGVGSRIRPLTDNTHKSLLPASGTSIFERMLQNIQDVGIKEVVVITGYRSDQIKKASEAFKALNFTFIHNDKFESTNTGYSLLLSKNAVSNSDFVKFDADVVFENAVLKKLIENNNPNCLCIDTNIHLDKEEVKVSMDTESRVNVVSKKLDPKKANGESIGIEKISKDAAAILFDELETLMKDEQNFQEYYDDSYTTLVQKNVPFHAVDITGLRWVEIDTHEDYERANSIF
jgi:choline kinase